MQEVLVDVDLVLLLRLPAQMWLLVGRLQARGVVDLLERAAVVKVVVPV